MNPCHQESRLEAVEKATAYLVRAFDGVNGDVGIKGQLALIVAYVEQEKQRRDAWRRALLPAVVGIGIVTFVAVLVAAATGVINLGVK